MLEKPFICACHDDGGCKMRKVKREMKVGPESDSLVTGQRDWAAAQRSNWLANRGKPLTVLTLGQPAPALLATADNFSHPIIRQHQNAFIEGKDEPRSYWAYLQVK